MAQGINIENNNQDFIEEDEIDLKELFLIIWKNKFNILIFSFVITSLAIIYTLSKPNIYKSSIVLAPQTEQKNASGGLSSLASIAGISLGGTSSKDPSVMIATILSDYSFNEYMVKKYNLTKKLSKQENLVFALGFNGIYNLFNSDKKEVNLNTNMEDKIFATINFLKGVLSVSVDKKSSMITLSSTLNDRFLAKELVDIYLNEVINRIKLKDMKDIDNQIKYYNKELSTTYDVSLKEQLSKSLSALMQKRVFSQANDYYLVSKVVDSRVSYIKEKFGPKRGLIVVVAFVTSIILGIFGIFFIEFIRDSKEKK